MKKTFLLVNLTIYSIVSFIKVKFHQGLVDVNLFLIVFYDILSMFFPLILISLLLRPEQTVNNIVNYYVKILSLIGIFIMMRGPLFGILFQSEYTLPFTKSIVIIILIFIAIVKLKPNFESKSKT